MIRYVAALPRSSSLCCLMMKIKRIKLHSGRLWIHLEKEKSDREMEMKKILRKTKSFISTSAFTFLLFSILASCAQIEKAKETSTIKDVVMSYNKGLINAAKTGNMEPLKNIASEDVLRKLYFWITAWKDSDLYMDAELKTIKFKNVTIKEKEASVLTSEEWVYEYRNTKNKQIVLPRAHISYEMEYILHKKWIINRINIKSEKQREGKGKE